MKNAKEISMMLADRAELVCMYLLPNGRKQGKRWHVGSVNGEQGDSLRIDLIGSKAGVWADFSSDDRGDLLELWQRARGLSFVDALSEAKKYLGIADANIAPAHEKKFTRPKKPSCKLVHGEMREYLTESRMISSQTIDRYKVAVNGNGEIIFPILRGSELINIKYLTPRKAKGQKNQWRQESDAEPCLFGWQGIDANARSVVITEGEIDALSLADIGKAALSIPAGANNTDWVAFEYEHLARFDDIVLMFDMDEAGQKHVQEIAKRLGLERTRIAKLPLKDANEMICANRYGELVEAVNNAEFITPKDIKSVKELGDSVKSLLKEGVHNTGKKLPWGKTESMVGIRSGEMSIWNGYNGHGKSQLLGYVIVGLIEQGEKVCIFSGEMLPKVTTLRMCKQINGGNGEITEKGVDDALGFLDGKLWFYDKLGNAKAKEMLELFEYAVKRYGVTQFVIDSLMRCGIDEDDYRGQKAFIDALCDFKMKHQVHIHLVVHSRKGDKESASPDKMDVKGSGTITDACDNLFIVFRNKKKEEDLEKNPNNEEAKKFADCYLFCRKQRNHPTGWEGRIALWFNKVSYQYLENPNQHIRYWLPEFIKGAEL